VELGAIVWPAGATLEIREPPPHAVAKNSTDKTAHRAAKLCTEATDDLKI